MITFEQARQIVADTIGPRWPAQADFTVAPWGWETDTVYIVVSGPYAMVYRPRNEADFEWLIPSNEAAVCVDKQTGEITYEEDPPTTKTPCGAPNPDNET